MELKTQVDIRVIHLPKLLLTILRSACGKVDKLAQSDLVSVLAVCQSLLKQIKEDELAVEGAVGRKGEDDDGATSASREQLTELEGTSLQLRVLQSSLSYWSQM